MRAEITCPDCKGEGSHTVGIYDWSGGYGTERYEEIDEPCEFCQGDGSILTELDAWEQYVARFGTLDQAMRFEQTVLSAGREFLPQCARDVIAGDVPGDDYYDWLTAQLDALERDLDRAIAERESAEEARVL